MAEDITAEIAALRDRIEREPNTGGIRFRLGLTLMRAADYAGAASQFADEVSLFPQYSKTDTLFQWARCCVYRGEFERAAQLLEGLTMSNIATSDNGFALKGDVLRYLGRLDEARDAYFEAIAWNHQCVLAHRGLTLLSHRPNIKMERPTGFALPLKNVWYSFDGLIVPDWDEDGTIVGYGPIRSTFRVRLFRGNVIVASRGFDSQGTGINMAVEMLAKKITTEWGIKDWIWINHHEARADEWQSFTQVTFKPTTRTDQFGDPIWHPLKIAKVEEMCGYRFVWKPKS